MLYFKFASQLVFFQEMKRDREYIRRVTLLLFSKWAQSHDPIPPPPFSPRQLELASTVPTVHDTQGEKRVRERKSRVHYIFLTRLAEGDLGGGGGEGAGTKYNEEL